jgi:hypothetical protein
MVVALNTKATQYMPGDTEALMVSVNNPVVVTRASTPTEARRVPEELYSPTKFCEAVMVAPAVLIPQYNLVREAERATKIPDR